MEENCYTQDICMAVMQKCIANCNAIPGKLFPADSADLYENLPTKKIEVDSTINDLADFAINQGINYKILKLHNPWMRDKKLTNPTKKKYVIEIPTSGY